MGQLSERSETDASGWTELERGFFAAAPPEVAVPPPPPMSFDDLVPVEPARERRSAPRGTRKARAGTKNLEPARRPSPLARTAVIFRRLAQQAAAGVRPVALRASTWTMAGVGVGQRRLVPLMTATRARAARGLGALLGRLASDLPEAPDRRALVAALVALALVSGLSARVLGSRADARAAAPAPALAATAAVAAVAVPEAPAVAPTPAPEADTAPEAAPATPRVRASAKRHHGKHHAAPTAHARATVLHR